MTVKCVAFDSVIRLLFVCIQTNKCTEWLWNAKYFEASMARLFKCRTVAQADSRSNLHWSDFFFFFFWIVLKLFFFFAHFYFFIEISIFDNFYVKKNRNFFFFPQWNLEPETNWFTLHRFAARPQAPLNNVCFLWLLSYFLNAKHFKCFWMLRF